MYYPKMVTLDRNVLYNPPPSYCNKSTIVMIDWFFYVFDIIIAVWTDLGISHFIIQLMHNVKYVELIKTY